MGMPVNTSLLYDTPNGEGDFEQRLYWGVASVLMVVNAVQLVRIFRETRKARSPIHETFFLPFRVLLVGDVAYTAVFLITYSIESVTNGSGMMQFRQDGKVSSLCQYIGVIVTTVCLMKVCGVYVVW